ncbi:uncharacterized protein LOC135500562 [Lineus longissimus]|uniref:uncharacterized protein LOC135500562 n=1 Tax=Lineus longissimus TaxID=88925 RepID=UPI002B4F5E15
MAENTTESIIVSLRHLKDMHKEEREIIEYMAVKDPKKKRNLEIKFRNLGEHLHNTTVIRNNSGILSVQYRSSRPLPWQEYVPCEHCLGYYAKRELRRHVSRCPLSPELGIKKYSRVVVSGQLLLPVQISTTAGFKEVLVTMASDEISRIVKGDHIILALGAKKFEKFGLDHDQWSSIHNTTRELGKLLRALREATNQPNSTIEDFIDPCRYRDVVACVKQISGFCGESHQVTTPSLALKLGHSIKKCEKIVKKNAMEMKLKEAKEDAAEFIGMCNDYWTEDISTHALRNLHEAKRNKIKYIPLTNDVKILSNYLRRKGEAAFNKLSKSSHDSTSWRDLAEVAMSQLILFNMRRQGEVSKMKVEDFKAQHTGAQEDVLQALSPLEKELCTKLRRIEIVGKKTSTVPMLITAQMQAWIELVIETRDKVGIPPDNQFLFARTFYGSLGHFRGTETL